MKVDNIDRACLMLLFAFVFYGIINLGFEHDGIHEAIEAIPSCECTHEPAAPVEWPRQGKVR